VVFTGIASLLLVGTYVVTFCALPYADVLQAAEGVSASLVALVDVFERIENVFRRLEAYVGLPPTTEMMDIIVKVMVEVLLILALVTKEIKQGKLGELVVVQLMDRLSRLT